MATELVTNLAHPSDVLGDVLIPLLAALVGAIVGALASYWASSRLAKKSSEEILKRDADARRDQDLRAARQIFVKVTTITNSLGSLFGQIQDMIAKAERDGNTHMPIWQRLSTFPAIDREPTIEFDADELAIYIAAKRPDYVDDLLLLSRHYSANLGSLATFAQMKTEFHYEISRLGHTTRDHEGVSSTQMRVPKETANYVKVKSDELDFFTTNMCQRLSEALDFARDVATRLKPTTESYLGSDALPDLKWAAPEDIKPTETVSPPLR